MVNSVLFTGLALLMSFGVRPAAAQPHTFDVASIREHKAAAIEEGGNRDSIEAFPGSLTMRNVNLLSCIRWAWDVKEYQVTGPAALTGDRYDILAKTSTPVSLDQMREMFQRLLAERFQLRAHRETKEQRVYLLATAQSGPKLHKAEPGGNSAMTREAGSFVFHSRSMPQFADDLSGLARVDRPVLDRTGIGGIFDFNLKFGDSLEDMKRVLGAGDGPSIFTLVEEQLGLKIEAGKGAIAMVIVERVERRPTEN